MSQGGQVEVGEEKGGEEDEAENVDRVHNPHAAEQRDDSAESGQVPEEQAGGELMGTTIIMMTW